ARREPLLGVLGWAGNKAVNANDGNPSAKPPRARTKSKRLKLALVPRASSAARPSRTNFATRCEFSRHSRLVSQRVRPGRNAGRQGGKDHVVLDRRGRYCAWRL